jgi:hypothetical protein
MISFVIIVFNIVFGYIAISKLWPLRGIGWTMAKILVALFAVLLLWTTLFIHGVLPLPERCEWYGHSCYAFVSRAFWVDHNLVFKWRWRPLGFINS